MADESTILARLKLQGVGPFVAGAGAASKSILMFGAADEKAAASSRLATIESKALGQGLYALRRYAFYGETALLGAAAAGVKMGITFDENKRQAEDAFTATLHSVSAARREVNLLTADTHLTGLQLGDIAREAETMQSFGFTIGEVNKDVLTLANYAERAKKGLGGFESIVGIFDRVHQKGALTGLDLRSLAADGIPAIAILQKELHLTDRQVRALQANKLVIPAQYALPALQLGLQQRADVLGTNLEQQLGVTHSFLSQIFGTGENGLFGFITNGLERINNRLSGAAAGQRASGLHGLLLGLDPSGKLLAGWEVLAGDIRAFAEAAHVAWTLAWPLRKTIDGLTLGGFLLARQTNLIALALKVVTFWYVLSRTRLIALTLATKGMAIAETAYIASLYLFDIAAAIATADMLALSTAMSATPAGVLIFAIAALAVGFYELGRHINDVKQGLLDVFTLGQRLDHLVINIAVKLHLGGQAGKIGGTIARLAGDAARLAAFPELGFSGLASGGFATTPGWAIVGEHGPEFRYLPAGGQIWPMRSPLSTMTAARTQPLTALTMTSTPVRAPMLAGGGTITHGGGAIVGDGGFPELAHIPSPARAVPLQTNLLGELAKRIVIELDVNAEFTVDGEKMAEASARAKERRRYTA